LTPLQAVAAAFNASVSGCDVTTTESWPSSLYWGHWTLEDSNDNDFNDFVGWTRITHGYNASDHWVGLLVEMVPAARGSFFTHRIILNVSAPYTVRAATGWQVQRYSGVSYAPLGAPTTYAALDGALLFADTGAVIGVQSTMLTLSQRFVNTRLSVPRYAALEFVHARATPEPRLRSASPADACGSRYRVHANSVFISPLFANTTAGEHSTVADVCPTMARARWVGEPRHQWALENIDIVSVCPLFANCTSCLCGVGMGGLVPCREMCCRTWSETGACAFGALNSYPL